MPLTSPHNLSYAAANPDTCPLCQTRKVWKKTLYGHRVCKKCYYKFINRRQVAYIVDALVLFGVAFAVGTAIDSLFAAQITAVWQAWAVNFAVGLCLMSLFVMKDGLAGYSPGKRLTGVRVLDDETDQPIGFGQSFKRNSILLLGQIPFVGFLVGLVVVIVIALKLGRGYRPGDRLARTRVIWTRYANSPVFNGERADVCLTCGYDLRGNVSGICPECGTPAVVEADEAAEAVA